MITPSTGSDYSALQQNNPYRNFKYTPGFWDYVLGHFNDFTKTHLFRTPEEKYRMDMENQARAYDAQIAEVQREEMYNSPEEQAARMREAGINPDLQQSGINGGQATPFDNQAVSNMPSADYGEAQQAMNFAGQIFTRVAQIPMSVMSLIQSGLKIKEDSLNLFSSINEAAANFLVEHQGSDPSWWTSKSKEEILHYVMNMYQVKEQFPLVSQRRQFAAAVYERSRALSTRTNQFKAKGDYLQASTDPMNVDETLVRTINDWQAKYNEFRLECMARYEQRKSQLNLPEGIAEYENQDTSTKTLQSDLHQMELEGVKALREFYQSLFNYTGNRAYGYAVSMTDSIINGEITKALTVLAAGQADNGISLVSTKTTPPSYGTRPRNGNPPSPGTGTDNPDSPTVETPGDDNVATPLSGEYWRKRWNDLTNNFKTGMRILKYSVKEYIKNEFDPEYKKVH